MVLRRGNGRRAWSTLLAAAVLACAKVETAGPAGSGGTPSSITTVAPNPALVPPTTVAALCDTFPAAWGDLMARCYGGEVADWASLVARPCSETAHAEVAGRITLDQQKVAECFAVLAGGECLLGPMQGGSPCGELTTGSIPAGQPCKPLAYGDECAPDAYCHGTSACAGYCIPRGVEGDNCHGLYVDLICGAGLDCDGPSAACRVPGTEGKPCAGELCEEGLYCDGDRTGGTCQRVKTAGPCRSDRACAAGFICLQTDVAKEGACTRVKPTGTPCTFGLRECAGRCSPEGICRVVTQEGEFCISPNPDPLRSEFTPCGAGLFCDRLSNEVTTGAICRRQLPLGSAWPDTVASGNACDNRDTSAFRDPDTRVCTVCN
jgi:hypothetical protein